MVPFWESVPVLGLLPILGKIACPKEKPGASVAGLSLTLYFYYDGFGEILGQVNAGFSVQRSAISVPLNPP
jgi:hypothetical protein